MGDKQSTQERILREIWEAKRTTPHHTMGDPFTKHQVDSLRSTLACYSDGLLDRVSEFMTEHPVYASMIANCVAAGEEESLISEYMRFTPSLVAENNDHLSNSLCLIRALRFYSQLPKHEDYGAASLSVQVTCANLLRVACAVDLHLYINNDDPDSSEGLPLRPMIPGGANSDMYMMMEDEALVELVVASSDSVVDLIVRTIQDRRTVDVDEIRVVLDSPALSVAEGAL